MALDRQSIERKDFPVGSHGYDPEAVDAHLNAIAEELEEFKSASRRRNESLAASAGDQVRAIIETAERSAAEIERGAGAEAREIREEAQHEAHATREQAAEQVREHVTRVAEATASMQARLEGMESELSALIESLRTGSSRLGGDLRQLEADLGDVREAATPAVRTEFAPDPPPPPEEAPVETYDPGWDAPPEPDEPEADGLTGDAGPEAVTSPEPFGSAASRVGSAYGGEAQAPPGGPESGPLGEAGPAYEEPSSTPFGGSEAGLADETSGDLPPASPGESPDDSEGARLIALNMALNGTPREETARYLADNFRLPDRDGLLDEVYASVEG